MARDAALPRIWLDAGTAEGNNPAKVVADARLMREALTARGWNGDLHYEEAEGHPHNEWAWSARFGGVLEYLFPAGPAPLPGKASADSEDEMR